MTTYQPSCSLQTAKQRAQLYANICSFFFSRGVLEVQTPLLSQAATTDVHLTSVPAQVKVAGKQQNYYLHTSPEFAMKRLLASWQVAMYQICPVFRDAEVGNRHNIEFTMLEWYRPNMSLDELANELGDLLTKVLGHTIVLDHYRYADAFTDFVHIHPFTASVTTLAAIARDHGLQVNLGDDHQAWLDLLFSHLVEPHLGKNLPTVIYDYPPATAALAKTEHDSEGNLVAKRFELYINGLEIANAYDELADGATLRQRFTADNLKRQTLGLPVMPIDEHLIAACDDIPPCSGIAVGLDRLLMVMLETTEITDVLNFTTQQA